MALQTPLTPEQLQRMAQNQVDTELGSQIQPLEGELSQVGASQGQANQNLNNMFGNLMPYVQGSAQQVQSSYDQAQQAEQGIFTAAQANLADLARQRAQEAQTLAQQMGGPVSANTFTESVTPSQQYLAQAGSGQLLHSLQYAQAGNQQAQAFAGQVFPLVKTEQQAQLTKYFEGEKKKLQEQIAQLQGGRGKAVNARLSDLQTKERAYQLDLADNQLNKLKAAHDWTATKRTLANEDAKLKLAKDEAANQRAVLTGTVGGKKTIAAKQLDADIAHMNAQDKATARQLGISERELALKRQQLAAAGKETKRARDIKLQSLAMDVIDQATNPKPGASIEQTVTTEITEQAAVLNKSAYSMVDKDGKTHYFLDRTVKSPGTVGTPVQDPQKLYDMLIGYKIPPAMAKKLVKSKLGTTDFEPGKTGYSMDQLRGMPFSEMRGVAIQLGWRPDPKHKFTKDQLLDWIAQHRNVRGR